MVSDVEIVRRLTSVVQKADLSTTTIGAIRKELERDLGVDLSDKKAFIREQVDLYLKEQQAEQHVEQEAEQLHEEEELEEPRESGEDQVEVDQEPQEEENEEEKQVQEGGQEEDSELESKPSRKLRGSNQEPDSKRFRAKIDRAIRASLPKEKKKRAGGGGGLNKVCSLSPELQAIIGETELPRTQVVKQLWVYIKEKDLQAPDNRRKIVCDEQLRVLFGVDSTDIFKMNKLLSRHIWPLDRPADGEATGEPKYKKPKTEKKESDRSKAEKETDRQRTEKRDGGRGRNSSLCPLSDALVEFLGTDQTEMAQTDIMKYMWEYIAANKLQDPADKKTIFCDDKLEGLFGCRTFVGFDLTKLLTPHLKREPEKRLYYRLQLRRTLHGDALT